MEKNQVVDVVLLLIRAALGVIFIAHGAQKLFGAFGGGGIEGSTQMIKGLGWSLPVMWAWVLAVWEFAGGILLVLGILPRVSAAGIAVIMLVAIFQVHGPAGFFAGKGGFEYQLLLLVNALAILIAGGGGIAVFNRY